MTQTKQKIIIIKQKQKQNKEEKHTCSVDGGFDKTFYISTTNKTNSNNNWCLPNHKGEIFIVVCTIDFMDLKLQLWHISKTIKSKAKKRNIPVIVWF